MSNYSAQDGISFDGILPLSWSPITRPIPAYTLDEWMHTNVAILRALSTMDAVSTDKENELGTVAAKAIERLEAKIDLSLNLLASLLAQKIDYPEAVNTKLSAHGVEWISSEAPTLGSDITLSLYLSHKIPQQLVFPAKVTHTESTLEGQRTHAVFLDLNEEMKDWLERTVFRYHRRAIQSRHSAK